MNGSTLLECKEAQRPAASGQFVKHEIVSGRGVVVTPNINAPAKLCPFANGSTSGTTISPLVEAMLIIINNSQKVGVFSVSLGVKLRFDCTVVADAGE